MSLKKPTVPPLYWPIIKPWRHNYVPSCGPIFPTTLWSFSYPIMIIINLKHMCREKIYTLKKMRPSMRKSINYATLPPAPSWSEKMWWWFPVSAVFIIWVTLRNTGTWSSPFVPAWQCPAKPCFAVWWKFNTSEMMYPSPATISEYGEMWWIFFRRTIRTRGFGWNFSAMKSTRSKKFTP